MPYLWQCFSAASINVVTSTLCFIISIPFSAIVSIGSFNSNFSSIPFTALILNFSRLVLERLALSVFFTVRVFEVASIALLGIVANLVAGNTPEFDPVGAGPLGAGAGPLQWVFLGELLPPDYKVTTMKSG